MIRIPKSTLCLAVSLALCFSVMQLAGCSPQLKTEFAKNGLLAASYGYTVAIKKDGNVVAVGQNESYQCSVNYWTQVVAVAAGGEFTLGLRRDGTVVGVGRNESGQLNVSEWKDIVAIAAGSQFSLGLKKDGTVKLAGNDKQGQSGVADWKGIIAIAAGDRHAVGVKSDGTVLAVGDNQAGQCDVSGWKGVVAVAAGGPCTYGLKSDGTVASTGYNEQKQLDVGDWRGIVALSTAGMHVVGLKGDGTVVAAGWNDQGECDVGGWKNIVAVAAGTFHTVGLKSDGTVVATGANDLGQCAVSSWTNIGWDPNISVTPEILPTGTASAKLILWSDYSTMEDPSIMAIIDAYRKVEPGVTIEFIEYSESYAELDTRIAAELAAGNPGPDLLAPQESYVLDELVKMKLVAPLNNLGDLSAFPQDTIDAITYDGKFFASIGPITYPLCIFYNKTFFESAGISVPVSPMAFTETCAKLKPKGIFPIYYNDTPGGSFLSLWMVVAPAMAADFFADLRTGKASSFKDPRFLATLTTILGWKQAGYLVQLEGTGEGFPDIEEFAAGHVAMIFSYVGYSPMILKKNPDFVLGAFAFPGSSGPVSAREARPGFAVGAGSLQKDAAAAFVRYACTLDAQKFYVQFTETNADHIGFIPAATGVPISDPVLQEFASKTKFTAGILTRLNKASVGEGPESTFLNNIQYLLDGSMTPEQFGEAMDQSFDAKRYQEFK